MPRTSKTKKSARSAKPDKLVELRAEARQVLHAALDLEAEQVNTETIFRAQDLFYGTVDLRQQGAIIRRCIKAVRTNPNAPDPLSALAEFVGGSLEEKIEVYKKILSAGERDLGQHTFEELGGGFWGFIETRPYMRAKHRLAGLYEENQDFTSAVRQYEEMLKLNPNDNQGIRYSLLGHYLMLNQLEDTHKLWKQYEGEYSAFWAWGKVLLEFLSGNLEAAREALQTARKVNPHAEAYLGGSKPMPKELPGYYSPGQESEAIFCFAEIGPAWFKNPQAQRWLEKH